MMNKRKILMGALLSGACIYGLPANAENLVFKDKAEFGSAVREYILENPEVLFEAIDVYREREDKKAQADASQKIAKHAAYLTDKDAPSIGNPDADITIIEFFDYNCGYCKRALPDIQKVVEADKNVRVVFRELAILGSSSKNAALWSLAAHKQGKYFEYHVALMGHSGPKQEAELMKLAEQAGLDAEKLKEDANSAEIAEMLEKDAAIAREIGVQGTPAFIVGSQFIPGYVGENGLKKAIAEEREKLKKGS